MKTVFDAQGWRERRGMAPLLDALDAAQGKTRYVGGAVRDDLLGLPVSDVDLATQFPPEEVRWRLDSAGIKAVPTGVEHGTITAVSDGQVVEVTTLRRDVSTDGRRATVAFSTDWQEDAARRDFTINALFADATTGEIVDYFGGLAHLEQRAVRFIGNPLQRIAEDHLRILRFFRFHARFGQGEPDQAALSACVARANDLMALSRERIADELLKLLSLNNPLPTVRLMVATGIFAPVLPGIGEDQVKRLDDLLQIERESSLPADPIRRLAALLPGTEAGVRVGARLRLSRAQQKRLITALEPAEGSAEEQACRLGTESALDRIALATHWRRPQRIAALQALPDWTVPSLPIGGGELIRRGITQGPEVARTLRRIESAWIAAGFPTGGRFDRIVNDVLAEARLA